MAKGKMFPAALACLVWLLAVCVLPVRVWAEPGAGLTETETPSQAVSGTETETETQTQAGWIRKKGRYYWQNEDGTRRTEAGFFDVGSKRYYITAKGYRQEKGFRKISRKYYYFRKNGTMLWPSKNGFRKLDGETYYFYKQDGHIATGRTKIGKKYYYFDAKGRLQTNVSVVKAGGKYYGVNKKGVMTKVSKTKVQCVLAARKFIQKHSPASQTNEQRFRTCFRYLMAHMRYIPDFYSVSGDYRIIDKKDGIYELALSTFNSPVLQGNCHRFASCVAAIARELGYHPIVINTEGDHSFVLIDGKYYDNMYGGLFGADSRPGTYVVHKRTVY